jgi:hypothetical protein
MSSSQKRKTKFKAYLSKEKNLLGAVPINYEALCFQEISVITLKNCLLGYASFAGTAKTVSFAGTAKKFHLRSHAKNTLGESYLRVGVFFDNFVVQWLENE